MAAPPSGHQGVGDIVSGCRFEYSVCICICSGAGDTRGLLPQTHVPATPNSVNKIWVVCLQSKLVSTDLYFT